MISHQCLALLLAVGLVQSAPQSGSQQSAVVQRVLGELQPTIATTLAQLLSGRSSNTRPPPRTALLTPATRTIVSAPAPTVRLSAPAVRTVSSAPTFQTVSVPAVRTVSAPARRTSEITSSVVSQLSPSINAAVAEALGSLSQSNRRTVPLPAPVRGPPTVQGPPTVVAAPAPARSPSTSSITAEVVTALQPSIAAAVAQALSASQRAPARAPVAAVARGLTEEEEAEYNAKLSANANYEYAYKVADDEAQAYMAHSETRNGQNVEGSYNYVDANGALVTVTYTAGPQGYSENREVQDGVVTMRNIPGPWTGPMADTEPAGVNGATTSTAAVVDTRGSSSATASTSDIIARVLAALQPQISGAVRSAVSASTSRVAAPLPAVQAVPVVRQVIRPAPAVAPASQSALIRRVLTALQPQISGAVRSAVSASSARPARPAARPAAPALRPPLPSPAGITGIFGQDGVNSVRIETPDFTTAYDV